MKVNKVLDQAKKKTNKKKTIMIVKEEKSKGEKSVSFFVGVLRALVELSLA